MTTPRKKREWTPEQRQEQARKLRERQIWLKSTGPRTAHGKTTAAQNACKTGAYSRQMRDTYALIRDVLRANRHLCALVRQHLKEEKRRLKEIQKVKKRKTN